MHLFFLLKCKLYYFIQNTALLVNDFFYDKACAENKTYFFLTKKLLLNKHGNDNKKSIKQMLESFLPKLRKKTTQILVNFQCKHFFFLRELKNGVFLSTRWFFNDRFKVSFHFWATWMWKKKHFPKFFYFTFPWMHSCWSSVYLKNNKKTVTILKILFVF